MLTTIQAAGAATLPSWWQYLATGTYFLSLTTTIGFVVTYVLVCGRSPRP
ncbi:hypothetical protein [Williamsia sterculiae]|uniref:Uncharacterized protein n=1 Tax=Williamsia sterculiae TaxID=1344003 RepID=A0A1N7GAC7_9NOCA|nr:hypothetical protein [Williamsia sterculiae]SIS09456.1 hypothetical protein SAMN05445060_2650 [Williamsia sterculiae]